MEGSTEAHDTTPRDGSGDRGVSDSSELSSYAEEL